MRKQRRYAETTPEELNAWLGKESGKPVHVATNETDLTAKLKRGLSFVRKEGRLPVPSIASLWSAMPTYSFIWTPRRRAPPQKRKGISPDVLDASLLRKKRTAIPHAFVLDALSALSPYTRPMFGSHAIYAKDKIVLILRDKPTYPADNGVWLASRGTPPELAA